MIISSPFGWESLENILWIQGRHKTSGHKIDSFGCCRETRRENFQKWDLHFPILESLPRCKPFLLNFVFQFFEFCNSYSNWGWTFQQQELFWASAGYKMFGTIHHVDHLSDETVTAQVFFSGQQTSRCFMLWRCKCISCLHAHNKNVWGYM